MKENFRTLLPYLRRYRRRLALGGAALLVKDLLHAALPIFIGRGVDAMGQGVFQASLVVWFSAAIVAVSAVKGVFQYWMRVILIGVSRDIEYDLRNDFFRRLTELSADFYGRVRTGDIMARATNDLNAVRMMLGPGLMYSVETAFTVLFVVAVMLIVDWPLTLMALAPAPLISLAVAYFGRRIHVRFDRIQKMFSDISSRVQENVAGVRVVRAYVQEQAELEKFEKLNREYVAENVKLARLSGAFMPTLQTLVGVTLLVVLWMGGARLLAGRITLGQFVMFNTYLLILVWPMIAFGWVVNLAQRGAASLARINAMMKERPSIEEPPSPRPLPDPFRGEIEFRGVEVRYPSGKALDGVSLRIPAGATVAIVGHTGSGKSTLVQLVARILDPTAGSVLIDGVDVRQLSPAALRREIGYVPQETILFSATLAENISFGVENAAEADILRAAGMAGLGPDLAAFPGGLATVIGERGITLSGGQKQRTAIARAILRDPGILILDDALSSVDTITEDRILSGLADTMRGRTTILISHRVSTVRNAERIFVIEKGRLAEEGSHEELLAAGGYYADLYRKQLLEEELAAI
ncbi:MAG: ABC transporter ATP-binding protein [Bryobacterales bacterium]|nr:ABC transporter ATP-binding protein [Bryobacterales bacterium]